MLQKILIGLAVAAVLLVVVVATRPDTFHVERSLSLAVPAERAFARVNDFRAWRAWSPWEGKDPSLKRTYSGAPAGVGAERAASLPHNERQRTRLLARAAASRVTR